jgi:hypothetical protein
MGLDARLLSGHCSSGWSLMDDRAPGPTDRKQGTRPVTKGVRPGPRTPRASSQSRSDCHRLSPTARPTASRAPGVLVHGHGTIRFCHRSIFSGCDERSAYSSASRSSPRASRQRSQTRSSLRRPKRRRARPRRREESCTPHGPFAPTSAPGSPSEFHRAGRSCGTPCAMGRSGTSSWRARCDSLSSPSVSRFRGDRPFLPFLRSARRTTTHWSGLSGTSRPGRVALRRPRCARCKSGRDAFNRGRSCSASAEPTGSCMRG